MEQEEARQRKLKTVRKVAFDAAVAVIEPDPPVIPEGEDLIEDREWYVERRATWIQGYREGLKRCRATLVRYEKMLALADSADLQPAKEMAK